MSNNFKIIKMLATHQGDFIIRQGTVLYNVKTGDIDGKVNNIIIYDDPWGATKATITVLHGHNDMLSMVRHIAYDKHNKEHDVLLSKMLTRGERDDLKFYPREGLVRINRDTNTIEELLQLGDTLDVDILEQGKLYAFSKKLAFNLVSLFQVFNLTKGRGLKRVTGRIIETHDTFGEPRVVLDTTYGPDKCDKTCIGLNHHTTMNVKRIITSTDSLYPDADRYVWIHDCHVYDDGRITIYDPEITSVGREVIGLISLEGATPYVRKWVTIQKPDEHTDDSELISILGRLDKYNNLRDVLIPGEEVEVHYRTDRTEFVTYIFREDISDHLSGNVIVVKGRLSPLPLSVSTRSINVIGGVSGEKYSLPINSILNIAFMRGVSHE